MTEVDDVRPMDFAEAQRFVVRSYTTDPRYLGRRCNNA